MTRLPHRASQPKQSLAWLSALELQHIFSLRYSSSVQIVRLRPLLAKKMHWQSQVRNPGKHRIQEDKAKETVVFNLAIAIILIFLAVILRLLPHEPNFAPIAAVAIFGGAVLPKKYALAVPLTSIIATDLIIGFHDLILVTWGAYALIALASNKFLRGKGVMSGISAALGASIFFFFVTNFAVWLSSGMYEHTLDGLVRCYTLALPFFRNTLASDILYSGALFGLYSVAAINSTKFVKSYTH